MARHFAIVFPGAHDLVDVPLGATIPHVTGKPDETKLILNNVGTIDGEFIRADVRALLGLLGQLMVPLDVVHEGRSLEFILPVF